MAETFGFGQKVPVTPSELAGLREFSVVAAETAGAAAVPYFRSEFRVENKAQPGSFDPVTEADQRVETLLRQFIAERYPDHGVLGEEQGFQPGNGLTWVIDPIDGTKSFMTGMLHWGLLLALFDGEEPILGVMHQPVTGETFVGTNEGAEYRGPRGVKPLRCRPCTGLSEAGLASTGPEFLAEGVERDRFDRLRGQVRMTRWGGDCYLYCLVAMGQLDLGVEAGLAAFDIQALIPIVRGAGGVITAWDGTSCALGGRVLAAGDSRTHAAAMQVLAGS